uniref:Intersectin 2a n=1 Tax=Scophthalmus maximus TaxID=52904 RepID=A0A8D3BZC2_SCOMX
MSQTYCPFLHVWAITLEEKGKHDKQFDSLAPVLGYVSGEQARKFFLQSGLPASVLAEIWNLADIDSDGKMDRLEFSIAMKLIKLKLQGRNLPSALPIIMTQPPVSNSVSTFPTSARMGSMPNLSVGLSSMSAMSTMPILTPLLANPPNPSLQPLVPTPMTLPLITSSSSSSTTSLASNSPKTGASDWAVPQASRLKYRQQFNTLDKLMSGYLSGPQVRNALLASNLTQTQLATIWTLADVDKDGQLRADEFILAMHLVDMAKTGRPLPLTLPRDLVPPSLSPVSLLMERVSFEDKLKENFARGSAELEKRRLALEEAQRKERERRDREEREAQERREREVREQENRRRLEEERRLERQRQREEERLRELERKEAAKQEMERQRREEWERGKKEELGRMREGEQEEISQLRAKKRGLELELEAGNKHKQISDRLRDAQSKKRIQKAEVDLINQKRDARVAEISTLQLQFEVKAKVFVSPVCLDKLKSLKLFLWMYFDFFFLYAWATGMAEEAVSAGPGTTEADREAVDEQTVGEPGWLCGSYRGNKGWFPRVMRRNVPQPPPLRRPLLRLGKSPVHTSTAAWPNIYSPCREFLDQLILFMNCSFVTVEPPQSSASLLARAVSSWSAATETHHGFSSGEGDAIRVLQQRDQWWLGQLNGTQGWFPKSYVTLETGGNAQLTPCCSLCSVDAFDTYDSVQLEEYVALYTYESPEAGDLTFVEGDVVMVTEREGEWWRGCIGDQTGVFPSNYVRPVEPEVSKPGAVVKKPEIAQALTTTVTPTTHQLHLSPGQLIVVLAKNSTGWWLGELQARGKKRQRGWFHSSHVKLLGPTSNKLSPSPLPVCQVIAMYDYAAASRDELSFSKGQLINILDKTNPDWWKAEANGVTGLLPTNYVKMTTESDPSQQWCADLMTLDTMTPQERKRQGYVHELIQTEETYVEDLELVLEVFYKPMSESGRLTEAEMAVIFVNWRELILCNTKLLKALRVRKKTGGENMPVQLIGDVLASELAHMQPYIRFCSCQLNAAALLQSKTHNQPDFKDFLKKIATNYRCKGMPLSSFLLKPMQRITRYPLIIKNILEHTPEGHADRGPLREALERAEELCSQVNEGVREKENSDRLEWIQSRVQSEGPIEHLVFNSLSNCLGPRKLLHSGRLYKTKSSRELWAFLFNDFLLLTHSAKPFSSSGPDKLFSPKFNIQLKIYKTPLFLNEVLVKTPADPSSDEPLFHVSHIDRVYALKTETLNERATWVQKIKAASEHFIETEKKKREKAYQARSLKTSGIGRLLVTVTEAQELKACKPNGKSNPYVELTMGAQCYTSRPVSDTLHPKWNFNCQFFIKDLYQDVLCITVFEKDQFSPDDFLGRTEVPVATIKKEMESKGAANRRLLLHEVPTGEVWVKLDLQLYEPGK